jgi:hypothetical protein
MLDWHSDGTHEAEANTFAAELLMPTFLLAKRKEIDDVSIDSAKQLVVDFGTSLTSATIRLVDTATQPSVVALVEGARIKWISRGLPLFWPATVERGAKVPRGSLVETLVRRGLPQGDHSARVAASVWCPRDEVLDDTEIVEEVVSMPRLGMALVLLCAPDLPAKPGRYSEEENDDDEYGAPDWLKQW